MKRTAPFIRWAGGKIWLVPFVQELIKDLSYNNYHEPFMGGASIFFSMEHPHKSYLSDINKELVEAFCAIRDNPARVIGYLKELKNDKDSYYSIREYVPRGKYQRAARFIYLNTFSFNGIYRVNKEGKYNVPYGYREGMTIDYDKLMEVSEKLQDAVIEYQDFEKSKEKIQEGDLVFLDPPYTVSQKSNSMFIKYNPKLFSLDDQHRLARLIDHIREKKAYYIMTNAADEVIKEIFKNKGNLIIMERNSLIGGKKAYRGMVQEYIFTNLPVKGANHEN